MTRYCAGCRRSRALRDFDLDGEVSSTCLDCQREATRSEERKARAPLVSMIAAREHERRGMIAALVKIDAEIADLREQLASSSATFKRVEPTSVFDDD